MAEAEKAAVEASRTYHTTMRPYACTGCGLFHITGKRPDGFDVVHARSDGIVKTRSIIKQENLARSRPVPHPPTRRADMSEVLAMESPIVPDNPAAREKVLREYLQDKNVTRIQEVTELMQCSVTAASEALRAVGWVAVQGVKARWIPEGANPDDTDENLQKVKEFLSSRSTTTLKAVSAATGFSDITTRKHMIKAGWGRDGDSVIWRPLGDKITVAVPATRSYTPRHPGTGKSKVIEARRRKIARYLESHPSPTTEELLALLGHKYKRKVVQVDMAALGWTIRKGYGATWQPPVTDRPALHLVESHSDEPEATELEQAIADHPAGAALPEPEPEPEPEPVPYPVPEPPAEEPVPYPVPEPPAEDGWRAIPDPDALQHKSLAVIANELAPYGLEVRIQIRERR